MKLNDNITTYDVAEALQGQNRQITAWWTMASEILIGIWPQ